MSEIKVNAITNAAGGNTATINGMTPTADSLQGFRNRIINGGMVIDQRNAGASVTPTSSGYTLDRWNYVLSQASKGSIQQNAGSVTPPAGFSTYLGFTSASAYSITTSDYFFFAQPIEGYNVADLAYGTASAKTVTLSFWVYSSLTGTFGGSLRNNGATKSYPFTYTVSSANTWEQKSVTIAGDTASALGSTTSGTGLQVCFGLGVGSTSSATAGSWQSGNYYSATGATSVVGTNGATFYITGVQLEAGSVATPFERRDYGRELMMCQRYYYKQGGLNYLQIGAFLWDGQVNCSFNYQLPVTMRSIPTFSKSGSFHSANGSPNIAGMLIDSSASTTKVANLIASGGTGGVNGYSTYIRAVNDSSAYFDFSAEL